MGVSCMGDGVPIMGLRIYEVEVSFILVTFGKKSGDIQMLVAFCFILDVPTL